VARPDEVSQRYPYSKFLLFSDDELLHWKSNLLHCGEPVFFGVAVAQIKQSYTLKSKFLKSQDFINNIIAEAFGRCAVYLKFCSLCHRQSKCNIRLSGGMSKMLSRCLCAVQLLQEVCVTSKTAARQFPNICMIVVYRINFLSRVLVPRSEHQYMRAVAHYFRIKGSFNHLFL